MEKKNLNEMTYDQKTDYLVARIDALTEKVEKIIEMVDPKCPIDELSKLLGLNDNNNK